MKACIGTDLLSCAKSNRERVTTSLAMGAAGTTEGLLAAAAARTSHAYARNAITVTITVTITTTTIAITTPPPSATDAGADTRKQQTNALAPTSRRHVGRQAGWQQASGCFAFSVRSPTSDGGRVQR